MGQHGSSGTTTSPYYSGAGQSETDSDLFEESVYASLSVQGPDGQFRPVLTDIAGLRVEDYRLASEVDGDVVTLDIFDATGDLHPNRDTDVREETEHGESVGVPGPRESLNFVLERTGAGAGVQIAGDYIDHGHGSIGVPGFRHVDAAAGGVVQDKLQLVFAPAWSDNFVLTPSWPLSRPDGGPQEPLVDPQDGGPPTNAYVSWRPEWWEGGTPNTRLCP